MGTNRYRIEPETLGSLEDEEAYFQGLNLLLSLSFMEGYESYVF